MFAGRRIQARAAVLVAFGSAVALPPAAPAQDSGVGTASRGGQAVTSFTGDATRTRLAAVARRTLRSDGFDDVDTRRCSALRDRRITCRVRALEGDLAWTGSVTVTLRRCAATTSYLVEST